MNIDMKKVEPFEQVFRIDGSSSIGRFITYYGPLRLLAQKRSKTPHAMSVALDSFQQWSDSGFIFRGHCAPGFGIDISLGRIGRKLSQSKKDGSPAYSDVDFGPMKNWYRLLLYRKVASDAKVGTPHGFFSCMRCLIKSGYAFWDEIEQRPPPTFPLDTMHEFAVEEFGRAAAPAEGYYACPMWFRFSDWPCTCRNPTPGSPTLHIGLPLLFPGHEYCYRTLGQSLVEDKERARK
ncbi:hypothetical protein F4803DRAFT_306129 [Xylaria telfairii]|nr:hypothetical protein F4803DRAFT_306129 [Xylaria telfairii]